DPGLDLLGVEIATRPADLPPAVAWTTALPESVEGLVVANEWLDNIPCHVVEVDDRGVPRVLHVDPATGRESLGAPVGDRSVPAAEAAGARAVVRLQRDVLSELGVAARRPAQAAAATRPGAYVAALADAGQAAELTEEGGLGDFSWVVAHAPTGRGPAPRP